MDPFKHERHIINIRGDRECNFQRLIAMEKIYLFLKYGYNVDIILNSTQEIVSKIHDTNLDKSFYATFVDA